MTKPQISRAFIIYISPYGQPPPCKLGLSTSVPRSYKSPKLLLHCCSTFFGVLTWSTLAVHILTMPIFWPVGRGRGKKAVGILSFPLWTLLRSLTWTPHIPWPLLIYKSHPAGWAMRNVVFIPGNIMFNWISKILLILLRRKEKVYWRRPQTLPQATCMFSSSEILKPLSFWKVWARNMTFL